MRVIVAASHLLVRDAICRACISELGFTLAGETGDGTLVAQLVEATGADMLLIDLYLEHRMGIDVIEGLVIRGVPTRIVAMSDRLDDYTVYRATRLNLHGFVDKRSSDIAGLREALAVVARGGQYFSPRFLRARKLLAENPEAFFKILTDWEIGILAMIGASMNNEEIGVRLSIAPSTVHGHRAKIMRKLAIHSTPKLMEFATRHGLISQITVG